jgi:hypothetical protein
VPEIANFPQQEAAFVAGERLLDETTSTRRRANLVRGARAVPSRCAAKTQKPSRSYQKPRETLVKEGLL